MITVILGIVLTGLWIIAKWDKPLPMNAKMYLVIFAGSLAERSAIRYLAEGALPGRCLMLSVVGGCLLLASVTDIVFCQVYNFVWWLASLAVLISMQDILETSAWSLAAFFLLQFIVFRPMYGRADCYGFCICAAAEAAVGMKLRGFLVQMLLAWTLLFLVQAVRRNIDRRGNLKQPVPFLPYITISFWLAIALEIVPK